MWLPSVQGVIRRRVLINYRVEPELLRPLLPERFRPLLIDGHGLAGICLIRLEQIRPAGLSAAVGISNENAAHRIAVEWIDDDDVPRHGVFILRRDSNSRLNMIAGGRIFPGLHRLASFTIEERPELLRMSVRGADGLSIDLLARPRDDWPVGSLFAGLAEATEFHREYATGYSLARGNRRCEGIRLATSDWQASSLELDTIRSSFFDDQRRFPAADIALDHVLLVRDLPHCWHRTQSLEPQAACV